MLKVPSAATLKKYGLNEAAWLELAASQGNVCAICKKEPSSGRLNVDHEHVKGYKKMDALDRPKYIRGLLCYICNFRVLTRGMTLEKARNAVIYLENYALRKL